MNSPTSRHRVTPEGYGTEIEFTNVQYDDAGTYRCSATNTDDGAPTAHEDLVLVVECTSIFVISRVVTYLPGEGGGHVLVTEFRGMALNGLFCADVLRPFDLVPFTDFTHTDTTLIISYYQIKVGCRFVGGHDLTGALHTYSSLVTTTSIILSFFNNTGKPRFT